MRYAYMTIGNDETEVTYSKSYKVNNVRCVDVCVETATEDDLINVIVQMPFGLVKKTYGMNTETINKWLNFIKKNYTLIDELSRINEKKEIDKNATSIQI